MNNIIDLRKPQKKEDNIPLWIDIGIGLLGIDGITIAIVDIPKLSSYNYSFSGMAEKLEMDNTYRLYLDPLAGIATKREVVCHECIHIKQYYDKRLVIKDKKIIVFDGKEYLPPYNPYHPHELEAFKGMGKIKKEIRNQLRNK